MKHRERGLIILVIVCALILGGIAWATHARADFHGGSIHHGTDAGYDPPILVKFAGETTWTGVAENVHSDHLRPNGQEDVNYVKVRNDDEQISCPDPNGTGYFVWLDGLRDADNVKALGEYANLPDCVIGLR